MSSEGTTNDPSLPPTWEALVRRIAREVAVEVVESAEMWMFDFRTTYTFRVPRGEETSAQPAGHGLANAANMRDPPTGPRPEVGPPSGEDDATAQFLYCGRCGFELTERIRAYGDARVREAINDFVRRRRPT